MSSAIQIHVCSNHRDKLFMRSLESFFKLFHSTLRAASLVKCPSCSQKYDDLSIFENLYQSLFFTDRLRNFEFSVAVFESQLLPDSEAESICYTDLTGNPAPQIKWLPCTPHRYAQFIKLRILTPNGGTDLINIGELEVYGY